MCDQTFVDMDGWSAASFSMGDLIEVPTPQCLICPPQQHVRKQILREQVIREHALREQDARLQIQRDQLLNDWPWPSEQSTTMRHPNGVNVDYSTQVMNNMWERGAELQPSLPVDLMGPAVFQSPMAQPLQSRPQRLGGDMTGVCMSRTGMAGRVNHTMAGELFRSRISVVGLRRLKSGSDKPASDNAAHPRPIPKRTSNAIMSDDAVVQGNTPSSSSGGSTFLPSPANSPAAYSPGASSPAASFHAPANSAKSKGKGPSNSNGRGQ